jgi:hypothetical protein
MLLYSVQSLECMSGHTKKVCSLEGTCRAAEAWLTARVYDAVSRLGLENSRLGGGALI